MAHKKNTISIIGMGVSPEDVSSRALAIINAADVLIGGRRQLALFADHPGEKIPIGKNAAGLMKQLKTRLKDKKVAVLASGDPNFFGIANLFYQAFDKKRLEVLPNITAFQEAFGRIREPWDDVQVVSIHGRELKALDALLQGDGTFVVYCDHINTPARVAEYLIEKNPALKRCTAWAFDSLGAENEKTVHGRLEKLRQCADMHLGMVIIKKEPGPGTPYPGIPDADFSHRGGMITKRDIRMMTLARLALRPGNVLWDVGAGSGSVAIEAATLCPGVQVYAVEKDPRRFREMESNFAKFNVVHGRAVLGSAPEALKNFPAPDSVFIGGSGGGLSRILELVKKNIQTNGHIVINCVTMATLQQATTVLDRWKWEYDITLAQLSHLQSGEGPDIFRADNAIHIIHACAK